MIDDENQLNVNDLYRNCEMVGGNILVIKEENEQVFGAYLTEGLEKKSRFYGEKDCFIFRFDKKELEVYEWVENGNSCFIYCSEYGFGIGMGY